MDQFKIFFVALVGGRVSLKNHRHFEEHIPIQILFGENVICNNKKNT